MRRWVALAVVAVLATGSVAGVCAGSGGVAVTAGSSSAGPTAASVAAADAVVRAAPAAAMIPGDLGWLSSNWAGYAVSSGPYRSVSGRWTVPTLEPTSRATYSATWVGIDGFSVRSLIQAGVEADYYGGSAHYSAWWEILPAPAVTIRTLPIRAGDTVTVTIARVTSGRWRITIRDSRSGTFASTRTYAGRGTSVEWIEEAPLLGRRPTQLAAHAPVTFSGLTANGAGPHLAAADGGAMIRHGVVVNTPSLPDPAGDAFALGQRGRPQIPGGQ